MVKKIFCILALCFTCNTYAADGSWRNLMIKADVCEEMGEWAAMFYRLKAKGQPKFTQNDPTDDPNLDLLDQFMLDYAWDVAQSEKQAWRGVWAKCMDNFDALVFAKKSGKVFSALPY